MGSASSLTMRNGRSLWIARSSPQRVARGPVTCPQARHRLPRRGRANQHLDHTNRPYSKWCRAQSHKLPSTEFSPGIHSYPSLIRQSVHCRSGDEGPSDTSDAAFGRQNARRRVSRVLSRLVRPKTAQRRWRPFLWDARRRAPRATDPGGGAKARPMPQPRISSPAAASAAPTWSCSRWGLPCRRRCRPRGALLPHHFTRAARPAVPRGFGGVLSVALSLGSPPPGVTRHRTSVEPGLSSLRSERRAAARPSGTIDVGNRQAVVKGLRHRVWIVPGSLVRGLFEAD